MVSDTGWPQIVLVYLEVARVGSGTAPDAEKVFNQGVSHARIIAVISEIKTKCQPEVRLFKDQNFVV